jgi:hypothetical protein
MSTRRASRTDVAAEPTTEPSAPTPAAAPATSAPAGQERVPSSPGSRNEAEAQYVAARDSWTEAMRHAGSGRSADLASLAITQEAYEAAAAELERWRMGARIAIPIVPEASDAVLKAAVEQQIAWRRVLQHEEKEPGLFGRLRRRLNRRR